MPSLISFTKRPRPISSDGKGHAKRLAYVDIDAHMPDGVPRCKTALERQDVSVNLSGLGSSWFPGWAEVLCSGPRVWGCSKTSDAEPGVPARFGRRSITSQSSRRTARHSI